MEMRSRVLLALAGSLLLGAASAESQTVSRGVPGVETQSGVLIVAELAEREAAKAQQPAVPRAIPRGTHPGVQQLTPAMMRRAVVTDVVQPAAPHPGPERAALGSPLPLNSFAALGDSNTAIPPDTHGAAGPLGLVVALNTDVGFQYRNGTFSRFAIMSLPSFWSTVCNTPFDPKVLYDHLAARWVFAAVCEAQAAGSSVLIGSSFTNDAYGGWNTFRIDADAGNTYWADYPSIGYNKDWVAVSVNMFPNAGGAFHQAKIYVFKKADLYKSGAVATHTELTANEGFTLVPAITHDASLATLYLVDQGWTDGTTDFVRISTITGDVGSEVLTEGVVYAGVTSTRWDNGQPGGDDFAPQQGSENKIDAGDARVQNAFYRNGSLWFAHTIFLPQGGAARSAVQWWQVTPDGTVTQRGRIDDDDQNAPQMFYACPSLAVNADDDVMIGFASVSADSTPVAPMHSAAAATLPAPCAPRSACKPVRRRTSRPSAATAIAGATTAARSSIRSTTLISGPSRSTRRCRRRCRKPIRTGGEPGGYGCRQRAMPIRCGDAGRSQASRNTAAGGGYPAAVASTF